MPHSPPAVRPDVCLQIDNLEIVLGDRQLRLDAPCTLAAGRLYLIVGPSGSGKSSFARALLGFGQLTNPVTECRGSIALHAADGQRHPLWQDNEYSPATRSQIAFLPQSEKLGFIDALSLADNLLLFSHLDHDQADQHLQRLATQFRLNPMPRGLASASGGERIRLSAVRGLLPRHAGEQLPALIVADEPTAGLDRLSAQAMSAALLDLARSQRCVVLVITHEPHLYSTHLPDGMADDDDVVRLIEFPVAPTTSPANLAPSAATTGTATTTGTTVARLRLSERPRVPQSWRQQIVERLAGSLAQLGALALSPVAFIWGLLAPYRPRFLLRQAALDAVGPGTHAFSLIGCLLIAGTAAYFIFERLPKPELLDPLLLPEIMTVTGHTLVRVVLPLGACGLITTKLGAAQAARLASAVRGGLLETLAMAGWRVEAYALVPAAMAQILAMTLGTLLAVAAGLVLAGLVYVAGHEEASLSLTVNLMLDGLERAPHWWHYLAGKIAVSGFLGGSIAALCGIVPSQAKDDLARAVHRTLLWSVLAVIACQCAFVIAEFRP